MTNAPISPLDQMRTPDGPLDRLTKLEAAQSQNSATNAQAQSLSDLSLDVWGLNASFPSICQGRLTAQSGNPTAINPAASNTLYFSPYIGNLIGLYNGSSWEQIAFSELSLPIQQSQTGTTHNGTAVIDGLTDTSQLVVGMWVTGTGISTTDTVTIISVDSATQVTVSENSSAGGTVTITFKVPWSTDIDVFIVNTGSGVLQLRMVLWNARASALVTGATNATPIVLTTTLGASVATGKVINVRNVTLGGSPFGGTFRAGTVTGTTIQLLNFDGTNTSAAGAFSGSGGIAQWADAAGTFASRASALALQDGIYVSGSNPTWRYLGTVHVNNSNQVNDGFAARFIWNYYNRMLRPLLVKDSTATWNSASANTWLPDHNSLANRVEFVVGLIENGLIVKKTVSVTTNATSARSGVELDTISLASPFYPVLAQNSGATNVQSTLVAGELNEQVYTTGGEGYHFIQGMEFAGSTTNVVWAGAGSHLIEAYVWG